MARPARDLTLSTAFYRDLLELPVAGGFEDHDGYDGIFFALPGGGELELTTGLVHPTGGTDEDLLVLYVRTLEDVRRISERLVAAGVRTVPNRNPYWSRHGETFLDPDGYRTVVAAPPAEHSGGSTSLGSSGY